MVFPVFPWMWEFDRKESWAPKNWCFWTVVLEKTLVSPLDCKEIQPVHSEDQPWDFFGRNDAKAEAPVLWPPHVKSWLIGKDSDTGRDWGQEEKATTEDEMAGWYHWLDGRESEWTLEVGDGQGGLACCDSWGCKELDTTKRLNWTENKLFHAYFLIIHFWNFCSISHMACQASFQPLFLSFDTICASSSPYGFTLHLVNLISPLIDYSVLYSFSESLVQGLAIS